MNTDASLQAVIDRVPSLVDYLHSETLAPHFRARTGLTAKFIPPEFTNWREEQRSWRETAALFDQTHHMPELFLKGPGALPLLEKIGINSFANFEPGRGKQFIGCAPNGYVIGECIVYYRDRNDFLLVSGMGILNWVQYQAKTGGYDIEIHRDDPTPFNPTGRRIHYRFQLDGPVAGKIFHELIEGDLPELRFFHMARVKLRGHDVTVLRHGMAGNQGVELSGPYEDMQAVRSLLVEEGKKHGLCQIGTKAYFTNLFESGWFGHALPAIFSGEELRPYREWLPADGWEGQAQLTGSFYSSSIEDYYVNPWDLGYEKILKFDHDFIGKPALEAMSHKPKRTKVTLVWNHDDLLRVYGSLFGDGPRYKFMDLPVAYYGFPHCDEVRRSDGHPVGISSRVGYSSNEREMLSMAIINAEDAKFGDEVSITWGEQDRGKRRPHIERHEQTRIRAIIAPAPYAKSAQTMKSAPIRRREVSAAG